MYSVSCSVLNLSRLINDLHHGLYGQRRAKTRNRGTRRNFATTEQSNRTRKTRDSVERTRYHNGTREAAGGCLHRSLPQIVGRRRHRARRRILDRLSISGFTLEFSEAL